MFQLLAVSFLCELVERVVSSMGGTGDHSGASGAGPAL